MISTDALYRSLRRSTTGTTVRQDIRTRLYPFRQSAKPQRSATGYYFPCRRHHHTGSGAVAATSTLVEE